MENFKETIITECFRCGTRYVNYFYASPCCRSIVLKVDENGNRTSITFLSVLSLPQPHLAEKAEVKPNENCCIEHTEWEESEIGMLDK